MSRSVAVQGASIRQIPSGDKAAVSSFASLEWRMNAEHPLCVPPTEADVESNLASRTLATSLGGEGRILYHNFDKALP